MKKYIVVKERMSESKNPIEVHIGEKVVFKEKSDPVGEWAGWILCQTKNSEGWIPYQIIDEATWIIKEDYIATEFDLIENEVLIYEKEINGWIWCYKEGCTQNMGWAPLNHIKLIEE